MLLVESGPGVKRLTRSSLCIEYHRGFKQCMGACRSGVETGIETAGSERRNRDPHIRLGPICGRKHGMTGLNMFQPTGLARFGELFGNDFSALSLLLFHGIVHFCGVFRAVLPGQARNFPDEPPRLPSTASRQHFQCDPQRFLVKLKGGCRVIRRRDFVLKRSLENIELEDHGFNFEACQPWRVVQHSSFKRTFLPIGGPITGISVALGVKKKIESAKNVAEILSSVYPGWISSCRR